jgi:hypothetical protein
MSTASQVVPSEVKPLPQLVSKPSKAANQLRLVRAYRLVTFAALLLCAFVVLIMREQDRTIRNQRQLIRELYQDSVELNAIKRGAAQKPRQVAPHVPSKHRRTIRRQASRPMTDGCVRGICG